MNIRYLSLHRMTGIIGLPGDADVELLPASPSGARAILTTQKSVYFEHMRRCKAFGATITQQLIGQHAHMTRRDLFEATSAGTNIPEGIHFDKPLLVIEASEEINSFDPKFLCHDLEHADFAFGMRLFDEVPLAERAKAACQAATSGILLAIPHDITATIENLGSVAYVIEEGTGRLIYSINPTVATSHSSHWSLSEAVFEHAVAYSRSLKKDQTIQTVVRLLSQSAQTIDRLQSFLTAWAGLEVFLDKTFNTYQPGFFATIEAAAAPSAVPFVNRLREVMDGKYNIRDKFVIVSSALDEANANGDIEAFKRLKDIRGKVHTMSFSTASLPVEETRNLLRKYLMLHLTRKT